MTPYIIRPSAFSRDEMALSIDLLDSTGAETRGAKLAKALGGRYAQDGRCFYLTPGRAGKWELLFKTGFSARAGGFKGEYRWHFLHPSHSGGLILTDAMVAARVGDWMVKQSTV